MSNTFNPREIVVTMIEEISRGNSINIQSFAVTYDLKKETLSRHFREVVKKYYKEYIFYNESDKCWFSHKKNFLNESFITPEEAVILSGILSNPDRFGVGLNKKLHYIVNNYVRRRHLSLLQPETIEDYEDKLPLFAIFERAIRSKLMIEISYLKNESLKTRILLPLRIINMEYYWYFIGEIENSKGEKTIRYFTASKVSNINITEVLYDESNYKKLLHSIKDIDKGMNAYYKPYQHVVKHDVMIEPSFEKYIKRAPYFSIWNKTSRTKKIGEKIYSIYTIDSTDNEYRDIIPTIQKYMPSVVVCNNKANEKLIATMRKRSEDYFAIYKEY